MPKAMKYSIMDKAKRGIILSEFFLPAWQKQFISTDNALFFIGKRTAILRYEYSKNRRPYHFYIYCIPSHMDMPRSCLIWMNEPYCV